jgi:DNA-binding CsgD family transcriptional regulator
MAISASAKDEAARLLAQHLQKVRELMIELKEEHKLDINELVSEEAIPVCVFSGELSSLEATVKYLKEEKAKRYVEIARLLNRDQRTIWVTYSKARKKVPNKLRITRGPSVPIAALADRKLSTLEAIVLDLKSAGYDLKTIARLLNKHYQTIWTTYRRGVVKNG